MNCLRTDAGYYDNFTILYFKVQRANCYFLILFSVLMRVLEKGRMFV